MATSIQQAATDAFVTYLQDKLPGIEIAARWPGKVFPGKAISVIPAGSRKDISIPPRILSKVNTGLTQTTVVWQVAACYQPYQLDIWATKYVDRDDIIAQLDIALHAGQSSFTGAVNRDPVGHGCHIKVMGGWEAMATSAYFSFNNPDVDDNPDSIGRNQFRATYRGGCDVALAISAVSPRQKTLKLSLLLDGVLPREEYLA